MKLLEVKVLARIGGNHSGVVQWEAPRAGCRHNSSAHRAEPRVQNGRHSWHEGLVATLRDGDQKLDGDDTAAFRSAGQAKADASNPSRRASRCVVATWLVDKGVEGRPDQETVAGAWRAH